MTEIEPDDLDPDEQPLPVLESERGFEASEADAAEQLADLTGAEGAGQPDPDVSDEADPADRVEQSRVVEAGDDEYR